MEQLNKYIDTRKETNSQYQYSFSKQIDDEGFGNTAVTGKIHVYENKDGNKWTRFEICTTSHGVHSTNLEFRIDKESFISLLNQLEL